MLEGPVGSNKLLLCVKAGIAEPKLIDEFITLVHRKTGIPQYGITLQDLEQCLDILAKSSFWTTVRSMKIGAKYNKGKRVVPAARSARVVTDSSDSDDSSSSSSSEGGEMDLGFSEDEQVEKPKQPIQRKVVVPEKPVPKAKVSKKVEKSSSESDSGSSSSSSSSSSSAVPRRKLIKQKPVKKTPVFQASPSSSSSSSSDSSSSSSSSESSSSDEEMLPEAVPEPKIPSPKKSVPKLSPKKIPVDVPPRSDEPVPPPPRTRKLRQPQPSANVRRTNIPSPVPKRNSNPSPVQKRPRVDTFENQQDVQVPVSSSPVSSPSWVSDYGRLVRQAIDNRRVCPFRTLGLSNTSSLAEVKKRWAKLCLLLHPDKAPAEWKSVPELVDANQAINEAKKLIEQRVQSAALSRPQRPGMHANPFTLDRGTFGKRRVELRWHPSPLASSKERVEKYLVFIATPGVRRDQLVNAGSVKEGTDPFFVLVEDDQRFSRFFQGKSITVSVIAANAAGNSDPLTIVVGL